MEAATQSYRAAAGSYSSRVLLDGSSFLILSHLTGHLLLSSLATPATEEKGDPAAETPGHGAVGAAPCFPVGSDGRPHIATGIKISLTKYAFTGGCRGPWRAADGSLLVHGLLVMIRNGICE